MTKLRILLADDHETVRAGLRAILDAQADMTVIAEAADGQSAVDQAAALLPDVVIMDVSMPRLNGLKATKLLLQCCPSVKVLTLTRHGDHGYLHQLLQAGASGYVLKQSRAAEILQAIRAVARGGTYLDPAIAEKAVGQMRRVPAAGGRDQHGQLSPREAEVLRLVAWGYSNKEVAARLELSVKTVETHKTNAMDKLGMHSRIEIVRYALLQGWLEDT